MKKESLCSMVEVKEKKGENVLYWMGVIVGVMGVLWEGWYRGKKKVMKKGKEEEVVVGMGMEELWMEIEGCGWGRVEKEL